MSDTVKLSVEIAGVPFKNPIIAASGTFGFGEEYHELYDVGCLGGISSKGLTLHPKDGNEGIRVWETASGMMNSVGLQNPGVEAFIDHGISQMRRFGNVLIANMGGHSMEDYITGATMLSDADIDMLELNISCPNVKSGGMAFGIKAEVAREVVTAVRKVCHKPLIVKLSPNAENIVDMAIACEEAGADALSLVNTFQAMAIDIHKRKPVFNNVYAGLSGAAIKPIALRMVHSVCKKVHVPVIGIGGIYTAEDILEFVMAGAAAVQIGTVNFNSPMAGREILNNLSQLCQKEGIADINEIRGIC
ncbi:MAG: dihydroorotate dehydrogenase [Bacteroidales bacterium]|nr:dihydroorotate dehydrogenase [Bacteroidales bacterium]